MDSVTRIQRLITRAADFTAEDALAWAHDTHRMICSETGEEVPLTYQAARGVAWRDLDEKEWREAVARVLARPDRRNVWLVVLVDEDDGSCTVRAEEE